ncbi:uncharacterized protein BCR38DRAFT_488477 [Pseudomassariella vexata]|uniref:Ubiquitin-like domain-containing protein n=1 Tax=Pseudomassariella vexata TaxID=1141098 RepID=A0A1Y2DJS9_9PEZI|nr:uncharacterized protein BCR38DRAFT_488477 [Pseudomassariella vexata]ORY59449.1 hypothetical protein BCR38DRAFT_488477 [Pseudomassariella vexata]
MADPGRPFSDEGGLEPWALSATGDHEKAVPGAMPMPITSLEDENDELLRTKSTKSTSYSSEPRSMEPGPQNQNAGPSREFDNLHIYSSVDRVDEAGAADQNSPSGTTYGSSAIVPKLAAQVEDAPDSAKNNNLGLRHAEPQTWNACSPSSVPEHATGSCSSKGKQKEKEKEVHFSTPPGHSNRDASHSEWNASPDRPPAKLPISFKDCVGRYFVFPWEKVKTWEGMERLILAAFLHVDILGSHVFQGHYDLWTYDISPESAASNTSTDITQIETGMSKELLAAFRPSSGKVGTSGASTATTPPPIPSISAPLPPSVPTPDQGQVPMSSSSSASSSSSFSTSSPHTNTPPSQPGPAAPKTSHQQYFTPASATRQKYIILPAIWEETIIPGILICMDLWPMAPQHSSSSSGVFGAAGAYSAATHGHGRGGGGGMPGGPPPATNAHVVTGTPGPPRTVWYFPRPLKRRGKTRKKPEA